jgi:hypothetical protein
MDHPRCPGQDMRYWKPQDISLTPCPWCGAEIEFWKDEPVRVCPKCRKEVRNVKMDLGCAKWCKYGAECLDAVHGASSAAAATPSATAMPSASETDPRSIKHLLINEMKAVFGDDERRIHHALSVLAYAEQILDSQGGDAVVVIAAAILHDIGIREAERKHGSNAGCYQEMEGPPIARAMLAKMDLDTPTVEHICRIIGSHHSARDIDTPEFRIVWDADWLVNVPVEYGDMEKDELAALIDRVFRTGKGIQLARSTFLGS